MYAEQTHPASRAGLFTPPAAALAAALLACMLGLGLTSSAQAAPGDLDSTFSGDGREVTNVAGLNDYGRGVAAQDDGKVVVVGGAFSEARGTHDFALARYNADGSLDNSFSDNGTETTDFGGSAASAVVLQTDGRIVVVGGNTVARYNSDGTLDNSFGAGGSQSTDLGANSGLALQPDGKIVVVGSAGDDFALSRYHTDGTLDTSFSGDGRQTTSFGAEEGASAVALQDDGKIVAVGRTYSFQAAMSSFALARYNSDGSLDETFASGGLQTTNFSGSDSASGVALQADGKVVAVGDAGDFALARYDVNGSLDTSFSGDGMETTDFGGSDAASGVALEPDAKIVAAGSTYADAGDFALARYEGGSEPQDTDPPETTITGGPTGTSNDRTPTFSFDSSEGGSTFECRIDGGAFSTCSSPHTTSSLSDGSHNFEVRATDGAGNTDATPASRSFTIVPDYRNEVLGTSGLVSYWRLGETSGTTVADAKGANHGSYRNGVLLGRPGALLHDTDSSAGFDGSNDYISVADHASLDTGDSFTLEAWVKRSSTSSSTKTVLSKGSGSYRLSFVNNVLTLTRAGAGTVARASVATTDTTGFHHIVAAKSGATIKLYIDGVDRTGSVTNRTIANTSTALNIGRDTAGSEYFPGLIDEVAIYDAALSATKVQQHFKASGR